MTISEIRNEIEQKGIKKTWLAKKMGVSNTLFSFWITETRDIPDDKKKELEMILS